MTNPPAAGPLPIHGQMSRLTRGIEWSCMVIAMGLVIWHIVRFAVTDVLWIWWSPIPILLGMIGADFGSGLMHWAADTWASETMPVLGKRFVRPFRVHHVNPDDLLDRDVIDTNGDVAMIEILFLLLALWFPLTKVWGQAAALGLVAFCVCGLPTNQVHQWAHLKNPPRLVRQLQAWGLILSRNAHQKHHAAPYVVNYCIATGWCNPLLTASRFFPRMEALVSRITGLQPRHDDRSFAHSVFEARSEAAANPRLAEPTPGGSSA